MTFLLPGSKVDNHIIDCVCGPRELDNRIYAKAHIKRYMLALNNEFSGKDKSIVVRNITNYIGGIMKMK